MADFNRTLTGLGIVQRAMLQLGLPVPSVAAGSSDLTVNQMWGLLTQVGLDLIEDEYKWQVLCKTQTITTDPSQTEYPMPDDWAGYYSGSGWNNTTRLPALGPMTPQIWRLLKARNLGSNTFALQYTIRDNKLVLYTSPSAAQTLQIDYMSRGWVQDETDPLVFRDYLENDADIVLLNPTLMIAKLKLKWREAKGFDTASFAQAANAAYERAKSTDMPASTLSTSPNVQFPYLGYINIPDTNYGS